MSGPRGETQPQSQKEGEGSGRRSYESTQPRNKNSGASQGRLTARGAHGGGKRGRLHCGQCTPLLPPPLFRAGRRSEARTARRGGTRRGQGRSRFFAQLFPRVDFSFSIAKTAVTNPSSTKGTVLKSPSSFFGMGGTSVVFVVRIG